MKLFLKTALAGAVAAMVATASHATPIAINNGLDFQSNGSTKTGSIDELGYTFTLATSIYLGNPANPGTKVIDTNESSVMNANGFTAGSHNTLAGPSRNYVYPPVPTGLNIDALNAPADTNGFTNGQGFLSYGLVLPQGKLWGLTYSYTIEGVTTATGVNFTSGYFNIFYEDGGASKQVLRLNLTSSALDPANLFLKGTASFDFDGNGSDDSDAFSRAFWETGTTTFYDTWLANPSAISFVLDTNVDPPLPTADELYQTPTGALIRQSNLDGSLVFTVNKVPEPGSLALVGAALAGLGFAHKRRKNKAA